MSLKVIFIAIMALLAVAQVRATALGAVALEQLDYDTIGYKITTGSTTAITTVTLLFDWAELSSDTNCITVATASKAAIPSGCNLNVQIYRSASAAYSHGSSFEANTSLLCGHTSNKVECVATIASGATVSTAGYLYGVVSGLVLKGGATTANVASYAATTSADTILLAATTTPKTPTTTGTLTVAAGVIVQGLAADIIATFGNTAAITAGATDFIDVYLPGMEMAAACKPTSPTSSLALDSAAISASTFSVTAASGNRFFKVTSKLSATGGASAAWTWPTSCGMKASANSSGLYTGYAVGRDSAYLVNSVMKLTYTVQKQVGKTANAVKVLTKASSAALTSTATEGVIGAAEAGRWVNDTTDQVLEFSFTGLGTPITEGTAKTLTLTVPSAWVVDTTNTKTTSTISVGGTDKTSTYDWTTTPTTVVLTPKTATDGAIAADAAVVLRFGNLKRTGIPVASSAKETFTFASASEVNSSTFYLPLANGMGMTGSTMKASIGGKTLTGSITGFVTALAAGASNTAIITPDTTYAFNATPDNECTGSLPAGKAITSTQSATAATLKFAATAEYDATAAKTSVLDFSCKLKTVPTTFATGKTVAVQRATEETGSYVISEDKGSSAASASSTVGVVLGAVFGVVGLAQLTL